MIRNADDVTAAVLREIERAPDARFREIMSSAVRHLHAWAREVHLTEAEFRKAAAIVAARASSPTSRTTKSCYARARSGCPRSCAS